jgi:hypothetical protein
VRARSIIDDRHNLDEKSFAEIVVWEVPRPVRGSAHRYKYRLALVIDDVCVLRYDNEAGKGDHRHFGDGEESYVFSGLPTLISDFWRDVGHWRI